MAISKEAVIANAVEAGWQHMHQEAPNELIGVQCHRLDLVAMAVILPLESDLAFFDVKQTIIGDRYAMSVSANVVEHLLRPGEWALGIDDPPMPFRLRQVAGK
jgi:hypothetical protein